ncbi:quinone-dependent dihydroorotate dehydrogenase [Pikeienuella piscinae]|uniref:Dihydroorotate dehydrogenase (quinone) n=1 Tax=Pikeienuella piscinae TaxID=2748098 RepID=A0A7L5BYV4_9RHOB|nr:quinone-dependent dihydroorotate dehydrogenase [Pikeienuella piscinae]QIE56303.1 quinone-dependent dihydroorotate dehydrogenase [Pikeienuella piscinae]
MRLIERAGLHALRMLDPEAAHRMAIRALKAGLGPKATPDPILATSLFGLSLPSPIGVAAGFDKNAEAPHAMLDAGFGFVEIGAVTPRPQPGNPRPRLFRLDEDHAAINRFGFNNDGLDAISARLRALKSDRGRVWANLGANKTSEDRAGDYVAVMRGLHGLVGAMTLNVSSPNTERLRDLQGPAALEALLARALTARDELAVGGVRTPVLLKIAPDLTAREIDDIAAVALNAGIDGIVATNTTLARDGLRSAHAAEAGGLSGAPLRTTSLAVLRRLGAVTKGAVPLVGVGGIGSAEDAYERIRAGASAVQLYTSMVFEGPSLGARIGDSLAKLLRRDGFATVAEAVGA